MDKKEAQEFKEKILKEVDSVTVAKFDKFYDILKKFFTKAYGLNYQFTLDELEEEIQTKEKNTKVREFMKRFIEEVQKAEFAGENITQEQLDIVKTIFKRLVDLIEVELEQKLEDEKHVKSRLQKKIETVITIALFMILLVVLVMYFIKYNIIGVTKEVYVNETTVETQTTVIENTTEIVTTTETTEEGVTMQVGSSEG